MNFYPFHVGDYHLRTAHLEPLEDLAYRRLIDLYYVNEGPLIGTAEALARIIRMRAHAADVAVVLAEFFVQTEAGWQHGHCDEVVAQYQTKAKAAAENGRKGGRPKKPAGTETDGVAKPEITQPFTDGKPEITQPKTNQEPITNNQEPIEDQKTSPSGLASESRANHEATFEIFYSAYPLKKSKIAALKAWLKLKPDTALVATIMRQLEIQVRSDDWNRDGGRYIKHPSTWINQQCWTDEVRHNEISKRIGAVDSIDNSAVGRVKQAIAERTAREAAAATHGYLVAEDGGNVRPPLDGECWRVV
jgi:uncharacterized protein YdaU (DUF1376 family)